MTRTTIALPLLAALIAAPASGLSLEESGPRVGVGDDPDQVVVGWHLDLGRIVEDLRFRPHLEAGFGDDRTTVNLGLPVHYLFDVGDAVTPYVGGGLEVAWIDFDDRPRGRRDDSEVELGPLVVGGIEWPMAGGSDMFVELAVTGGAHDARLMVGWSW